MTTILETSLTYNFVSPFICNHLKDAGLSTDTLYRWKICCGQGKLITNAFDKDDYYIDGEKHQDYVCPPDYVLPAYSIKDVERLLPVGWLVTLMDNGVYEISLSNIYSCNSAKAGRLPDAFAILLLEAIKRKIVSLRRLNAILQK